MKSVLIRVIISLFLCCCIVLNVFSLPASATSVAVVVGLAAIPVAVAVAAGFQALGVMSAANNSTFTTAVDSCSNWLTENSSFVVNGTVALLGLTNTGVTTSYLSKSFIQDIWEWLFTSRTVHSASFSPASNVTLKNGSTYYIDGPCLYRTCVFTFKNTVYCADIVISNQRYYYSGSDRKTLPYSFWEGNTQYFVYFQTVYIPSGSAYPSGSVYLGDVTGSYSSTETNVQASAYTLLNLLNAGTLLAADDLLLGQIQSPFQTVGTEEETIQIEIAPIYIDWTKYGVPDPNNPDGDPEHDGDLPMWLPTGIPSPGYDDSVITQNQQQAQSGVVSGDITFEPYQPSNPGSGNGSGNTGTNTGTNFLESLTQFFTPSGDITMYSLDLKDLFPFCIPFDIYNFLAALSADPVPPVFEFDLNLGVATEPMKIDLSNWSDLAAIIRTFELGLFCVGLALKTRELIGG